MRTDSEAVPEPVAGAAAAAAAAALRVAWIIFVSLPMGVLALWVLALARGGAESGRAELLEGGGAIWIWAAVGLSGFGGALFFRNRAANTAEQAARVGEGGVASAVQSALIVAWALLEAGALLAGVLVFLGADARLFWYAAPVYVLGLLLTYPRADWLGTPMR